MERTPGGTDPYDALRRHVTAARGAGEFGAKPDLGRLMRCRNIDEHLTYVPNAPFDACIQPVGNRYQDGFRIVVNRSRPAVRARFSIAHEICHTFFYELVPEIKYARHTADAGEEHLCNFGAAEFLIPGDLVASDAAKGRPSLQLLESLARKYCVTVETMLLRLRGLGLWKCSLLFWHRMVNGEFVLRKVYGDRKVKWEWEDSSLLSRVWSAEPGRTLSGRMPVTFERSGGASGAQVVHYQIRRRGDVLVCLWSQRTLERQQMPLFTKKLVPMGLGGFASRVPAASGCNEDARLAG